jgi:hypothetical protein
MLRQTNAEMLHRKDASMCRRTENSLYQPQPAPTFSMVLIYFVDRSNHQNNDNDNAWWGVGLREPRRSAEGTGCYFTWTNLPWRLTATANTLSYTHGIKPARLRSDGMASHSATLRKWDDHQNEPNNRHAFNLFSPTTCFRPCDCILYRRQGFFFKSESGFFLALWLKASSRDSVLELHMRFLAFVAFYSFWGAFRAKQQKQNFFFTFL